MQAHPRRGRAVRYKLAVLPRNKNSGVSVGKSLIFPIPLFLLPKFDAGKPGGESGSASLCTDALPELSGISQRAGMQLKYFGSKAWLAPHMDRLLGNVAVLHSPFFGSGKPEYYLAARRPGLEVRGVDAFEPVANLHRCYLRQDPVFLRSLLRLVGRRVDRRFYCGHLLPGAQRGAGLPARTSCCATASRESGAPLHSRGRWH